MSQTKKLEQQNSNKAKVPGLYILIVALVAYFFIFLLPQTLSLRDLLVYEKTLGQVISKSENSGRYLSSYELKVKYPYKGLNKESIISIEAKDWVKYQIGSQIMLKLSPKGSAMYAWSPVKIILDIVFGLLTFGAMIFWFFLFRLLMKKDYKKRLHNNYLTRRIIFHILLYFTGVFIFLLLSQTFDLYIIGGVSNVMSGVVFWVLLACFIGATYMSIKFAKNHFFPAWKEYKNKVALMKNGKLTEAIIASVERNDEKKNKAVKILYEFEYNGDKINGHLLSFVFINDLLAKPGDIITIYFDPKKPINNIWVYQ